jgi:hypothetical protein
MTTRHLVGLLVTHFTILVIAIFFLSSQIEAWENEVCGLVAEWSEFEHKTNNLLKLRHEAHRRDLKTNTPLLALVAPLILGAWLLGLGVRVMRMANTSGVRGEIELLLFAPPIVLMLVYVIYGASIIRSSKKRLDDLGR